MKECIFKCFGITRNDLLILLEDLFNDSHGVYIEINEFNLLSEIKLKASQTNNNFYDVSKKIFEIISPYVYAESDMTIEETLIELSKINNIKIIIIECVTGGNIISLLAKASKDYSKCIIETKVPVEKNCMVENICIKDYIKNDRIVNEIKMCYDIAEEIFKFRDCDHVIVTSGNIDDTNNLVSGEIYIAVGNKHSIDVYKNKFEGNRNEVIELASKAAMFYFIKKIRQNNFKNLVK